MPHTEQYKGSHRETLAALNYNFPSYGSDLAKALFSVILGEKIKTQTNWIEEEKKLVIDVSTRPKTGSSVLIARYEVYIGKNDGGSDAIIFEEVENFYGPKQKVTGYSRKIKTIPIEKTEIKS